MRLLRSYIAVTLTAALAWTCAVPEGKTAGAADTNGDRAVDVLDVQRVIAAVLRDGGHPGNDVNGDGRVDVLDFQCIVQAARSHDEAPSRQEPEPARRHAPPRPIRFEGMALARDAATAPCADDSDARWRCTGVCECDVKSGPREGRYLLGLTPHAPPVFA